MIATCGFGRFAGSGSTKCSTSRFALPPDQGLLFHLSCPGADARAWRGTGGSDGERKEGGSADSDGHQADA
jgi:hypothetical protein